MTRRRFLLALLLVAVAGATADANTPPTMQDQALATVVNMPIDFELIAEDADIDPSNPSAHPLTFSLLEGPTHGILIGDLGDVGYVPEHIACVELSYVPAEGFIGTEFISFSVQDPFDETAVGTITIQIDVKEQGGLGLLTGNWVSSVGVDVTAQTSGFKAFRSRLTEVYRIGDLTLQGIAEIKLDTVSGVKKTVFDSLRFVGSYTPGHIAIDSTIAFEPEAAGVADLFDYWLMTSRFSILDLDFTHTLYLARPQTHSYMSLHARGNVGAFGVIASLRTSMGDGCALLFDETVLTVSWIQCDVFCSASFGIGCGGFEQLSLSASGIPVPQIAWLPEGITLDAGVTFGLTEKALNTSLSWRPSSLGCVRVLAELQVGSHPGGGAVSGSAGVQRISIYGVSFDCGLPGGVSFHSATSFDPAKHSQVTGQIDYFEILRLTGPLESCCGFPGRWNLATYFSASSSRLFDWGMSILGLEAVITENFTASVETTYRSGELGDPTAEIKVGWTIRW